LRTAYIVCVCACTCAFTAMYTLARARTHKQTHTHTHTHTHTRNSSWHTPRSWALPGCQIHKPAGAQELGLYLGLRRCVIPATRSCASAHKFAYECMIACTRNVYMSCVCVCVCVCVCPRAHTHTHRERERSMHRQRASVGFQHTSRCGGLPLGQIKELAKPWGAWGAWRRRFSLANRTQESTHTCNRTTSAAYSNVGIPARSAN